MIWSIDLSKRRNVDRRMRLPPTSDLPAWPSDSWGWSFHRSAEEADEGRQELARSRRRRFASCANFMRRPAASRSDASDAAGIAYAVERDWRIISGGLHSVSLTEAGRRRVKARWP